MHIPQRFMAAMVAASLFVMGVSAQAATYAPDEDVMTSAFFTGTDLVRGYVGNGRPTFRVSTDDAFGLGMESIYLDFSSIDLSAFSGGPIVATLTMSSVAGGFGADATAGNPFTVSAQGVNANPFTSITDDTNPSGPISWSSFFNNNILPADSAALTAVDCTGCNVSFDVSAIVNDWLNPSSTNPQFIAMTGKNDLSGTDILHGFRNNSNTAANEGFTSLTITQVPEPGSLGLLGLAAVASLACCRGRRS